MADSFLLFVYGTLKRGRLRHRYLAGQPFLSAAVTRAGYSLLHLGAYPGMVAEEGSQVVYGELYEVDASLRATLDRVEGAPDLFDLGSVELEGVAGPVFSYFYRGEIAGKPRIASGLWDER